eukprot:c12881_g1_i6.p1 GENE.c12881_g1_i6~~c12881_g1_i6.p1  ORF type:complete len:132 (+),score=34.80 c12881_g1_i6:459-854(+)
MDKVRTRDHRTRCFTKSYHRYAEGTGSVLILDRSDTTTSSSLIPTTPNELTVATKHQATNSTDDSGPRDPGDDASMMRYFTPSEILRLHQFPERFEFPGDVALAKAYQLIGNSLNCAVVCRLLVWALTKPM